jgi:hypothetical protein
MAGKGTVPKDKPGHSLTAHRTGRVTLPVGYGQSRKQCSPEGQVLTLFKTRLIVFKIDDHFPDGYFIVRGKKRL